MAQEGGELPYPPPKAPPTPKTSEETIEDSCNLTCWDGLAEPAKAVPVSEDVETSRGAVTIANKNDPKYTSGKPVKEDKDLIPAKISIKKVEGHETANLTFSKGVKLWKDRKKSSAFNKKVHITSDPFTVTFYIEKTEVSSKVRGDHILLEYAGKTDEVKLTFGWIKLIEAKVKESATKLDRPFPKTDGRKINYAFRDIGYSSKPAFAQNYGTLLAAKKGKADNQVLHGRIGFKFEVKPSGFADIPGVEIDLTRQAHIIMYRSRAMENYKIHYWYRRELKPKWVDERPNDDRFDNDEDNESLEDEISSIDPPGFLSILNIYAKTTLRIMFLGNFHEFARVRYNGKIFHKGWRITGNYKNAGTETEPWARASNLEKWCVQLFVTREKTGEAGKEKYTIPKHRVPAVAAQKDAAGQPIPPSWFAGNGWLFKNGWFFLKNIGPVHGRHIDLSKNPFRYCGNDP